MKPHQCSTSLPMFTGTNEQFSEEKGFILRDTGKEVGETGASWPPRVSAHVTVDKLW